MFALSQLKKTYQQLRLLAGATLIIAPLLIVSLAYRERPELMPTLSHYYFFEEQSAQIRTLFTGFLILLGGLMLAYRGFSDADNWIHNVAGIAAIVVAFCPKLCDEADLHYAHPESALSVFHAPAAGLMFVLAAAAVIYSGGRAFLERLDASERTRLRIAEVCSLLLMLAGIAIYLLFLYLGREMDVPDYGVLLVEYAGFVGFSAHWLAMTYVIRSANRRRAGRRAAPGSARDDLPASVEARESLPTSASAEIIP